MMIHSTEGPPCRHMEGFLNQAADGSSSGWRRWYALAHAARCVRCADYLKRLEETVNRLRASKTQSVPESALNRLEALIPSEPDGATA